MTNRVPVLIVDYGMGNLRSVANAIEAIGGVVLIANNPRELRLAEKVILPGVGAFGDGMKNLRTMGWIEALNEEIRLKAKPFLGLCLGMQLLATTGTEHGTHQGLNWVPGLVERIKCDDLQIRVPHIGWNDVRFTKKDTLYAGLGDLQAFYFVHSYIFQPEASSVVSGVCSYGIEFAASLEIDNIFATQFHPEKSHKAGLAVLENFLNI